MIPGDGGQPQVIYGECGQLHMIPIDGGQTQMIHGECDQRQIPQ